MTRVLSALLGTHVSYYCNWDSLSVLRTVMNVILIAVRNDYVLGFGISLVSCFQVRKTVLKNSC